MVKHGAETGGGPAPLRDGGDPWAGERPLQASTQLGIIVTLIAIVALGHSARGETEAQRSQGLNLNLLPPGLEHTPSHPLDLILRSTACNPL